MKTLLCLILYIVAIPAFSQKLTIERIYSDPELSGPTINKLKVSPDGERVTYLKGKEEDFLTLDLWEYHIADQRHRLLVDSRQVLPEETLSDEEKARRERMRIANSGIIDYFWAPDSKALLFPLGGDIYLYDLENTERQVRRLTQTEAFETDPKISPQGRYVSFIRDQNIVIFDLQKNTERQLTTDGGDTIKNGMADFIAQEEMRRYTGYWWSPDGRHIAYTRVDESPIGIEQRYEIKGDGFTVYDQRYPKTGTANAKVTVGVVNIQNRRTRWMDIGEDEDIYIARVNWFKDSRHLAIQRQNRAQTRLDLLKNAIKTGRGSTLLTETSNTWINLHDALHMLDDRQHFIWASERSDTQQLYLYTVDGSLVRQITNGEGVVQDLHGVDEARGTVYFNANYGNPLESHLYRAPVKGEGQLQKLSEEAGTHRITMAKNARVYVSQYSNANQPWQTRLYDNNATLLTVLNANTLDKNHPYFPYLQDHVRPQFGSITAEDGQALYYQLFKPANIQAGQRYPVIVDVYGGPGVQAVKNSWNSRDGFWHQVMAQKGYVVFLLDNRGATDRGVSFESPLHRLLGEVEVKDQVRGVEFLKTLPYVDPDRIGIFGWSYGGYMAIMAMFKAPDIFKAGVSVAPVTDWTLYDTHYTERYLGTPADNPQGYDRSNVFRYIDGLKGSLLIMHGMADDNVLYTNATKLYQALQDRAIPFEQMDYPGKKHGIRGKKTRIHLYNHITAFFDRSLR